MDNVKQNELIMIRPDMYIKARASISKEEVGLYQ